MPSTCELHTQSGGTQHAQPCVASQSFTEFILAFVLSIFIMLLTSCSITSHTLHVTVLMHSQGLSQ